MKNFLLQFILVLIVGLLSLNNLIGQEFLVKDINPGPGWSSIDFKFRYGNQFYFVANSEAGFELWVSDGTPDGTLILKDIHPVLGAGSNPADFVELNDLWFFTADDGTNGRELWRTDGTEVGTQMLKDILPGAGGSNPENLTLLNGLIYFSANNGNTGHELWVSDGTAANTNLIADINSGITSSNPNHFTVLGTEIIFTAAGTNQGNEIWKTDGTTVGTQLIKDIFPGVNSSFPSELTRVNNKIYFLADDGINGRELWRTDGTLAGTVFTNNIAPGGGNPQARDLYSVGDFLFMVADDGTGNTGEELYRSDANAAPSVEIVELFVDTFGSTPIDFMYLGGDLFFNANNGINGFELWKAKAEDGTVSMLKDIYPGFVSSSPVPLTVLNDELIFKARGENIGFELWKTDGTESGTVLLGDLNTDPSTDISNSDPNQPIVKDGILYFSATDHINGYQIWRTDGTTTTTQRLTSIPHDDIFNNSHKPYFINDIGNTVINFVGLGDPYGEELWKVDIDPITITNIQTNSPLGCNGDTDGTIAVSISGGVGDPSCFTYQWSASGLNGLNLNNLPAGSYTLTVTDCVGFNTITTINIEEPTAVGGTTQAISAITCFGESDGTAIVEATGGTGAYSYLWDNGQTSSSASGLNAGVHTVTITDNNNCTGTATVFITQPQEMIVNVFAGPIICADASNGIAIADPAGGTAPYSYLWDNGETSNAASGLNAGAHTLTVTDTNGCTAIGSIVVEAYPEVSISFATQDVSCLNGANGSASAQALGGSGSGYTYAWQNGSTTATISDLAAGTYQLTVTDNQGCSNSGSVTILEPQVNVLQTNAVSCFGGADGSATVTISNANSNYTYLWDNGETLATAIMLDAGDHAVTITDDLTCSDVQMVTISEATEFIFVDSVIVDPACFGEASGSITYNFSGGTTPYNYSWSNGATSNGTLSGLVGNATYCVTISDANNCKTFEFCSTLNEPEEITTNLVASNDATCFGTCNGTATVNAAGGGDFIFTWSSGEISTGISSTAQNLCAGTNTVTISDGTCSVVETVEIGQPSQIIADISVMDASCFGAMDGSVSATATGGIGTNYTFEFSSGTSDLPAGTYFVIVTDESGCSVEQVFTVGEASEIVIEYAVLEPSCVGDNDASYVPFASGGTGPYTFAYDGDTMNLSAGTYYLTVTDVNNCVAIDSITINDPDPINIISTVTDISCTGAADGSVNVLANGGTGSFTFEYSSNSTINLEAGTYYVTATDANSCIATDSFEVEEPVLLEVNTEVINEISCFGSNDGAVEVTVSGGTSPFTFEYSSDSTSNLAAGSFYVTATDANGCMTMDSIDLQEPTELEITITIFNHVTCFNGNDANVDVFVSGGTGPYSFDLPSVISAGEYTVTVTDVNGCTKTTSFTITEPDEIIITGNSTPATDNNANGTATVDPITGGVSPYTVVWNTEPEQTGNTATDLPAGEYTATVTDGNGCTSTIMITVDMIVGFAELDEQMRFQLLPNPANEKVNVQMNLLSERTIELQLTDVMGRMVYQRLLENVRDEQIEIDLSTLTAGAYWVQLRSEKGQYVRKLIVQK
jgi:ELWxxDGT repeat protein